MPIRYLKHLTHIPCRIKVLWGVNPRFHGLYPGIRQVAYALLTRAPVAIKVLLPHDAPRLACVKPVASVHPEPGSNSSLFKLFYVFAQDSVISGSSILLTVFILNTCTTVVYVNFSKNSSQSFLSKRGAKVRIFIFIFQIFSKFFSIYFFESSFGTTSGHSLGSSNLIPRYIYFRFP